jgi:streptomycin 6-kinase
MQIPAGLAWWHERPGGTEWLGRLPALAAACARRWGLELGPPFEPANISLVVPAVRADGRRAVLKLNFPEPESAFEADALAHWAGDGAVELLAHDREHDALLIARCEPGTQLWAVTDESRANALAARVLERLWARPAPRAGPFAALATEAARWAAVLPRRWTTFGRPFERSLLDEAVSLADELAGSQERLVVVHQDLHGGNVLADGDGWRAIDPKPLAGEPAFDLASLVRDRRDELALEAHPEQRLRRRVDELSERLGLDRERVRRWAVVHALAWGLENDGCDPEMVACARALAQTRSS